ncbi:MAG: hypothetical protein NVS2B4_08460 [Ramlibacter sp.]
MPDLSQLDKTMATMDNGAAFSANIEGEPESGKQAALALIVATCFVVGWLVVTMTVARVAPTDNIEQLTWVRSLEWGYYKHPPLPTWLLWPVVQVFGLHAWTSHVLGALLTIASVAIVRSLLVRTRGLSEANLCALAILCVTYYNNRLYYYNHNVVLLFITAACAWTCWQALRTRWLGWWAALGVLLGLGGLTKYQIVITAACVVACWLLERGWRDRMHRQGAALAAGIACTIVAPHLAWLVKHDFPTLQYAMSSSLGAALSFHDRAAHSIAWLGDQLFNRALPSWLMVAVTAFLGLRAPSFPRLTGLGGGPPGGQDKSPDPASAFLLVWGVIPLSFIALVGLLAGADLQLHWGTAFMPFVIPAVLVSMHKWVSWGRIPTRAMLSAFIGAQSVLVLLNVYSSPIGPAPEMNHWRSFDIESLTRAVDGPIRKQIGDNPICVISGPPAIAGALALHTRQHPLVLIDGRWDRSPWVSLTNLDPSCVVLDVSQDHLPGFIVTDGTYGRFGWRLRRLMDFSAAPVTDGNLQRHQTKIPDAMHELGPGPAAS